MKSNFMDR